MAYIVTCRWCGEKFDRNTTPYVREPVGKTNRYSHATCHKKYQELEDEKTLLTNLIQEVIPNPDWGRIGRTIQTFTEKKGFTYKGIRLGLMYMRDVIKNDFKKSNGGIAYVEYIYYKAQQYYANQDILEANTQKIKSGEIGKSNITTEVIIYKKTPREKKKSKFLPLVYPEDE